MYPGEAQDDVWGKAPDALVGGCIAPTGKATPVDGGYRLRGQWSFGSNCDNSNWMSLGAMVETEGGKPSWPVFLLVPAEQYRIVDNWHTVGLAGTGSKDILVEGEVFVPMHRTVSFGEVLEQRAPGAEINKGGLFNIPFLSGFPPLLAIPAVAALRGAMDEFTGSVASRAVRGAFWAVDQRSPSSVMCRRQLQKAMLPWTRRNSSCSEICVRSPRAPHGATRCPWSSASSSGVAMRTQCDFA